MKKRVIHNKVENFLKSLKKLALAVGKVNCFVYYDSPFVGVQTDKEIHCCSSTVLGEHYKDDGDKFLKEMETVISETTN